MTVDRLIGDFMKLHRQFLFHLTRETSASLFKKQNNNNETENKTEKIKKITTTKIQTTTKPSDPLYIINIDIYVPCRLMFPRILFSQFIQTVTQETFIPNYFQIKKPVSREKILKFVIKYIRKISSFSCDIFYAN